VKDLRRAVTEEDIVRLTEIKIKRISKFDSFKADEHIKGLEDQLAEVQAKLDALVDHAVDYFKELKKQVRRGPRAQDRDAHRSTPSWPPRWRWRTSKLYIDREEGFVGWSLRNNEQVDRMLGDR
jgi:topoisomerase-4 subunit A